ncbi:hypothetical protein FQZ97_659670 [compost metagenome]
MRAEFDDPAAGVHRGGHALQTHGAAIGDEARGAILPADGLQRSHPARHVDEVFHLARDVKADVVALQQATDDLPAPRQHVEHIRRGEVGVVEEGDAQVRAQLAQVAGHHPQVVVVQPDDGTFGGFQGGAFGEGTVDLEEHLPVVLVEGGALPEGVQGRPEGFLGEALVEDVDLFLAQLDPRGLELGVAFGVHAGVDVEGFGAVFMHRPGDPGPGTAVAEEAQQGRDDAVRRGRPATLQFAVDPVLFIGQAVVDHHQLRLAGCGGDPSFGGDAMFAEETEVGERLENPAATRAAGMQGARVLFGGVQQAGFGVADADTVEGAVEHAQVVEGVAGGQHLVVVQLQPVGQGLQAAALVDALGQEIQIAIGGIQQVAAEHLGGGQQGRIGGLRGCAEVGAAAHLRHVLALQVEALDGAGDLAFAGPERIDQALQRLDRLQAVAVGKAGADVGNDEVRLGQGRVGQQWQDRLQAAAGDIGQADFRVGGDGLVEAQAILGIAGEKGSIEIGGK